MFLFLDLHIEGAFLLIAEPHDAFNALGIQGLHQGQTGLGVLRLHQAGLLDLPAMLAAQGEVFPAFPSIEPLLEHFLSLPVLCEPGPLRSCPQSVMVGL